MNDFAPEAPSSAPQERAESTPPLDVAARKEALEKAEKEAEEMAAREQITAETTAQLAELSVPQKAENTPSPESNEPKNWYTSFFKSVKNLFTHPVDTAKTWWESLKGWFGFKGKEAPTISPTSMPETPVTSPEPPVRNKQAETPAKIEEKVAMATKPEEEGPYKSFATGRFEFANGATYSLILKDGTKISVPPQGKILKIDEKGFRITTPIMMAGNVQLTIKDLSVKADQSTSLTMAAMGQEENADLSPEKTLDLMNYLKEHKNDARFEYTIAGRVLTFTQI